jgi:TatD DNase family protein
MVGIGGVVTYNNSRLPQPVQKIPLDRIVLETDSPYLTPVPFRGKRNESSYLVHIAGKIAEIKGCPLEEVAAATTANAYRMFGL